MDQLPEPGTTRPAIARGPLPLNHGMGTASAYDEAFHHPICREDRGPNRSRRLSIGAKLLRHHTHPTTIAPPSGVGKPATVRRSESFPPEEHVSVPFTVVLEEIRCADGLILPLELFG